MRLVRWLLRDHRQAAIIGSMAFSSALCAVLLIARIVYSHTFSYIGLAWNLFLAWLPMLSSLIAYNLNRRERRGAWPPILICTFIWLLFFPNAPYILTDILHLRASGQVPLWYDLIMLIAFAWTGTFLGLVSLYLMQSLVSKAAGKLTGWLLTLTALGLSGFGVYLGRFPRWNSWDVFTSPMSLLEDIAQRVRHPFEYSSTFVFSALFSLCLIAIYLMLVALVQFHPEAQDHPERNRS